MSQCVNSSGAAAGAKAKVRPSLLYNIGRVTSYTIIGGIIGAVGSVISFSGWARGLVAILSGIFMVIMGLSMTGLFPWMNKITPRLPRIFREKAGSAGRGKGPYIVGLLNGLMPCGPLQAMQIYALGTGSFISGALSMFFFSLGTLPLMFGLGAIITMLGSKFTKNMLKVSAVLVAVLGVIMLSRGLVLSGVGLPSLSSASAAASGSSAAASVSVEDGVQKISSTLTSRGYPNITVQKGVPVEWNLQADASNINGCNKTLIISEYNLQVKLKAGDNIIKFTPTESGTITYSCWMGMQTGQISVVDDLNGQSAQAASDESAPSSPGTYSGGMSCCTGNTSSN
jgi:sulfite exporter TauE/SafE